jgi:hypothetical protein
MIDATETRSPPTFRTMSAKTVVVATIESVLPDEAEGEVAPPEPQAATRTRDTSRATEAGMRPSLDSARDVIGMRPFWGKFRR